MSLADYVVAVLADSPVCFYKFDEASGNPADSSGNGFTISTVDGSPTYRNAGPLPGTFSVGSADNSQFNRTPTPSVVVDNLTLELWVRLGGAVGANDQAIWNVGSGAGSGFRVQVDTNNTFQVLRNGGAAQANSTGVLSAASFKHIVIVRRATVWEYWINGVIDTANAGTTAPAGPGANSMQWAQDLSANIQSFQSLGAFYATALSGARILAHYEAAYIGVGHVEPAQADSWAWWG